MMDITPNPAASKSSSSSTKSKAAGVGAGLSKAGQGLQGAQKASDDAASRATQDHSVAVPRQEEIAPNFHKGGTVQKDGTYALKAGEHVLTEAETEQARKHALMASGLKSLAKSGKASKKV